MDQRVLYLRQYVYDENCYLVYLNALATWCFTNCKWYIVMVVILIFFLGLLSSGSSGNTVHGTFVVTSPSLRSNIMTITCDIMRLCAMSFF